MLEPESLQAAVLAAAGEIQSLVNELGLSSRGAPSAKLVFESDLKASLRRALQFGRLEFVAVDVPLARQGAPSGPVDVVVAGRTRTPQLALEVAWHPRGEDHAGFAQRVLADIARMGLARAREGAEQAAVLVAAPPRFWRWLPAYAEEHTMFAALAAGEETPATVRADVMAADGSGFPWASLPERELPERLWTSLLLATGVRSPWADAELRLLETKGLGGVAAVGD